MQQHHNIEPEPVKSAKKKVLVPRKKLQSVPDLLVRGDEESNPADSLRSKILWLAFLVFMFYISLDMFLRTQKEVDGGDATGESEL